MSKLTPGWFSCCDHCGCLRSYRVGHDDTCKHGCNDDEMTEKDGDL